MTFPILMTASAHAGESGLFHSAKRSSTLLLDDADCPRGPDTHPTLTARVRTAIASVIVSSFTARMEDICGLLPPSQRLNPAAAGDTAWFGGADVVSQTSATCIQQRLGMMR